MLADPDFAAGGVTTSFIEDHPQLLKAQVGGDRASRLLTYLADVTVNQPHGAAPVTVSPTSKLPALDRSQPVPDGTRQLLREVGPEEFARTAARPGPGRGHRHHLPRRPPVAARDARTLPRPARRRRPRRPHHAGAVVGRVLGRGDVRRRAALPRRGPLGAAGRAARGDPQHRPPDAAARTQHGRLHAVPHRGHRGLRARGRRDRHRRVPHLRRAQRRLADAAGDRRGPRHRDVRGRGGALLHRRPVLARRAALHARLLPPPRRADRRRRRPRAGDQGHGRPAARPRGPHPRHRAARALRPARPPPHPRHPGRPARHARRGDRRRRRRGRRRLRGDGRHHVAARPLGAGLGDRPLRARDRPLARRRQRARALLGGHPPRLRALRVRACPPRPVGSTATRSPAASSPTCASRRSRSASARSSSRSRTCTPRPTTSSATS